MYCLSCRAKATISNAVESFTSRNGRAMQRSMCGKCGRVITTFCRKVPSLPASIAGTGSEKSASLTASYDFSSRDGYDSASGSRRSSTSSTSSRSAKKAKVAAAAAASQ